MVSVFQVLRQHIRFWVRTFWGTVLFTVIALAVAVQLGRAIFPIMNEYRPTVEEQLSRQLGVDIAIGAIKGEWHGLRPKVSLTDLAVYNKTSREAIFLIDSVDIEVSLLSTLRDWRLAFRQLAFRGLKARFIQNDNGRWHVQGLRESTAGSRDGKGELTIDDPLDIFLFGRRLKLQDTILDFQFRGGLQANVEIPNIRLENDAAFHRLTASFAVDSAADGGERALSLTVEGLGDPRDETRFDVNGYLALNQFPSAQVLAALGIRQDYLVKDQAADVNPIWQDDGQVNMQLWFSGTAQQGLTWRGNADIQGVPLIPPRGIQWPSSFSTTFSGDWHSDRGWQMALSKSDLRWPEFTAPVVNLALSGRLDESTRLTLDELDIGSWHSVFDRAGLLPEQVKSVFDELKPYGRLTSVQVEPRSKAEGYFAIKANISRGGVHPWAGVPAIDQVNGLVEASAFDGHIVLASEQGFILNFPKVYRQPLEFAEARGDVRWQVDVAAKAVRLSSGTLRVARDDVAAVGHFNLRLPFVSSPGDEPEMTLAIGVEKGFASLHRMLVPYTVPEHLYNWLGNSIRGGQLENGAFIYHGTLQSNSQLSRVLQLSARIQDAEIAFDPNWPPLQNASGTLLLDNDKFSVNHLHGEMMDVSISDGSVALVHLGEAKEAGISLRGKVHASSDKALELLKNSPIRYILGDELASWRLQGQLYGNMDLVVPFDKHSPAARQHIALQLVNNQVTIPSMDLTFTGVNGPLDYSDTAGIRSEGIKGTLWNQPVRTTVTTERDQADKAVRVQFDGLVDMSSLQHWTKRPELAFMAGTAAVAGELEVPLGGAQPILFRANSVLDGVQIALPPPFGKLEQQPVQFQTEISVSRAAEAGLQQQIYDFSLTMPTMERLNVLAERRGGDMKGVTIGVNQDVVDVSAHEFHVTGALDRVDLMPWYAAVMEYVQYLDDELQREAAVKSNAVVDKAESMPVRVTLAVKEAWLDELLFKQVELSARQLPQRWLFSAHSQDIRGDFEWFEDGRPSQVAMDYIHFLPDKKWAAEAVAGAVDPQVLPASAIAGIDLAALDPVDVNIQQWSVGDRDLGNLRFKLRPMNGGIVAYDLHAQIQELAILGRQDDGAELVWLRSDSGDISYFSGRAVTTDVGKVLSFWQMDNTITSKQADFDVELQWPGAPDQVTLGSLFGMVDLHLQRGRFIRGAEVGENPLVKLVGLLNFDTLARRLRLDFSDLNPEGMGYEDVSGRLLFKSGMINIPEPLYVDTPASQIQFVGNLDIKRQRVNAQLVATLPVAGNLTLAAALTGGLPMAVGVFVVSKLFKQQVDKVSSIRYRIKGRWDEPDVNIERIFENKTASKEVEPEKSSGGSDVLIDKKTIKRDAP